MDGVPPIQFGVQQGPQFDYVNSGNPTTSINPSRLYAILVEHFFGRSVCLY